MLVKPFGIPVFFLPFIREFSVVPMVNPVPLEDFHGTMLHLLGFDDKKLIYPFQGLDRRLT